ncbi:MAG: hypothetical protein WDW36_002698 [Sanguina aurantia]
MQRTAAPVTSDYSITLPEKLTAGGPWSVHRSAEHPYTLMSSYAAPDDHVRTLHDCMENSISKYPYTPFLGTRVRDNKGKLGAYTWMTYNQAGDTRTAIGSGLLQLGISPRQAVGLYSVNCREWVLMDTAFHAYSMVSVPLYDTLGPDAVEYICNHADLAAVGCSAQVLPILLSCISRCPSVKLLVVFGLNGGKLPELPADSPLRLVTLDQVEALGRRHTRAHMPPKPSDVATICYTSGTTGVPKGAVLTHTNMISNSAAICSILVEWTPGDRHICYLPLAHIYERINLVSCIFTGTSIGFYSGNVQELLDDVMALRPHLFCSVPRLWNRIYDRVMATIRTGSPIARALFNRAYAYKLACLKNGDSVGGRWGHFYDKVVFSKIRAKLGGEVKYMTTGASPISDEVLDFMRVCFGASVMEGYGMTEAACTIAFTRLGDFTTGHVGAPIPCCEVKLVDIPAMNYLTTDLPYPRGEVCVRGPSVFQGYYKDPVQTAEVLDSDGWLHTGDVGMWIEQGKLKIIDRKKNIFKLAQGDPFVLQAFMYGDSLKAELVAVIVPDPEYLLPWAKERSLGSNMVALCRDPSVRKAVMASMLEQGREAKLRSFEQVSAMMLHPEPFTVENDLLTPTFKLKRPQAKAKFQLDIDEMYASLPTSTA